ncbi:DNA alkylation repair protein [Limnohabitans radicicola]|uniref:DNA alkylation repair protein n=1 Tax=Limnohabitans radicicola TaxID=2771427 RepID=A0A927FHS1_9BURK|nr:DNA alkylation repair protein [Limnohabitans radicicola]MBD8051645.1 DNA alkylation repair protein [Limnohabitans radicicola]
MSNIEIWLTPIEAGLRAHADAQQAVPMKAYMLGQFEFLGIRAGPRRAAVKHALQSLPKFAGTADELLALAHALWQLPEREFRYTAIDLLAKHHKRLDVKALPRILQLVQTDPWWDTVDGLAGVVGDIVLQAKSSQPDVQHHMDACLIHPHLWVRRVAMLHQLGWREQTDQVRLFRYALTLAPETDFFIRKAIGWALRDHARTQPDAVRAFLARHAEQLSGLTRREAGKHLG